MTSTAEQTWKFDKHAALPDGPWRDEPDKVHWIDEASDLDCLIVRNHGGALCGYVGVPEGHPWHGVDYDDVKTAADEWPAVHGGLTYADRCPSVHPEDDSGICHVPAPGRPDNVWWLGFDCAHHMDYVPAYAEYGSSMREGTYRDIGYIKAEVRSLAAQAAAVSGA